jgi:hypothetical protein
MHTITTEARQKRFCLSLLTSLVLQSACLGVVSIVHAPRQAASLYVVIPLMASKPVFYQKPPIALHQVSVKWSNVRADDLRTLNGPNLRRKSDSPGYQPEDTAPVIGNPDLGFAAPLTLSFLDQPSRPVDSRIGDFRAPTLAVGSPRAGHGTRNGFLESGFGGGGGSGKPINREPVHILWKPIPEYTEEARNKKIEDDMVIDLIFTADRRIVVLRILQSLGSGLDEKGLQAVSQIVFRPATESGRAVDFRARVRVEFRLVERDSL